jgi:hypothetical protein
MVMRKWDCDVRAWAELHVGNTGCAGRRQEIKKERKTGRKTNRKEILCSLSSGTHNNRTYFKRHIKMSEHSLQNAHIRKFAARQ